MTGYVAFLRGINVGGINIKMADLRATIDDLGFDGVRTLLASGNVRFDSSRSDRKKLKADIEKALRDAFGYDAWVVLLDLDEVRRIADAYPFDAEKADKQPYVMLTSDPSVLDDLIAMSDELDPATEQIALGDNVLYWEVERGQTLKSTFGKATGKKKYKSTTTTRNLRTLHKVLA